jgi:threonine aldolase
MHQECFVDLRSDTVTTPTEAMREAMRTAAVGDDVYGEDPTVNRLEALAAQRLGKEASLFVPSGTMGNQVALMTHAGRGQEVILEESCHIYNFSVGGPASLAGILTRTLRGMYGILDPEEVRQAIRIESLHTPGTALVCLESPTNRGGGTIYPLSLLEEIFELAHHAGVGVHLDGARIFNAGIRSLCRFDHVLSLEKPRGPHRFSRRRKPRIHSPGQTIPETPGRWDAPSRRDCGRWDLSPRDDGGAAP